MRLSNNEGSSGAGPVIRLRLAGVNPNSGVIAKLDVAEVSPIFDQLFNMDGDAYSVAIDVMGMYVLDKPDRLEALRPQLRMAVANVHKRPKRRGSQWTPTISNR